MQPHQPLQSVSNLHHDPLSHLYLRSLMAGFILRLMNRLRLEVAGGLDGALILLDVLCHEREPPLGLTARANTPTVVRPITAIAQSTGIPHETVRRHLAHLKANEWLILAGPARYEAALRSQAWLALTAQGAVLGEFIWIASQVKEALDADSAGMDQLITRLPWSTIMTTNPLNLDHLPWQRTQRAVSARLARIAPMEAARAGHLVDTFIFRHLRDLRDCFEGDLDLPLLLGEIAHRNMAILAQKGNVMVAVHGLGARLHGQQQGTNRLVMPCNTNSLAVTLGMSQTTLRRKIERLTARGWVRADKRSLSVSSPEIRDTSHQLDKATLTNLLAAYDQLCTLGFGARQLLCAQIKVGDSLTTNPPP